MSAPDDVALRVTEARKPPHRDKERSQAMGKCFTPTIILMVCITFSGRTSCKTTFIKRPYGIRLCEELCLHLGGCSGFHLNMSDYSCTVQTGTIDMQDHDCHTLKGRVHLYNGTMNVSRTGLPCKRWADENKTLRNYLQGFELQTGESVEEAANYCRTEKNPPDRLVFPWCYVHTKKRWELCMIDPYSACKGTDCFTFSDNGSGDIIVYKGTTSTTASGHTCKPWASVNPKRFTTGESTAEAANYCRVVVKDKVRVPWCYTTSRNTRWEVCNIMPCFK